MALGSWTEDTRFDSTIRFGCGAVFMGFVAFVGGCHFGLEKTRLAIWGVPVEARYSFKEYEHRRRHGGYVVRREITIQFKDEDEKRHRVYLNRGESWEPPPGGHLDIIYLPDDPETFRLAEESGFTVLLLMPLGVLAVVVGIWALMHKQASATTRMP